MNNRDFDTLARVPLGINAQNSAIISLGDLIIDISTRLRGKR